MEGSEIVKDQVIIGRDSAKSTNSLIIDNHSNKNLTSEQSFYRQSTPIIMEKEDFQRLKKHFRLSPPQTPADRPKFRGAFGISITATVIWYICSCILLVIAFFYLILSALYFVSDTTTEQVIKLYGICGSGSLAIITFIIIFLDCCNGSNRKDHQEEALYRILQAKEAKEKALAMLRNRRIAEGKEKPNPFITQHKVSADHHHFHVYPPTTYHHPFVCPICHDLHASGNARHNFTDVAVDTSDKFAPVFKSKKALHKSTRDAQTEPIIREAERGTQTDRTDGTQTSIMELSGLPSNVTHMIHETTILKAPRNLLNTLKKSMAQQDKDIAISHAITDTSTTTAAII